MLLKDNRIIIPRKFQHELLNILHESHLGIVKTKQLAKDYVFWPGLMTQIEDKITRCDTCQTFRKSQPTEPLISHDIPKQPFTKIGVDLFHANDRNFLLAVDYYSKYPEVIELQNLTSAHTINVLKQIFARHGIPETVISDNGPQFSSHEYKLFSKNYQFQPIFTNPQYPKSNGQVERSVQTIKLMIKKSIIDKKDFQLALLNYRNTPIDTLQASPAQLLMNRRLRSKLPTIPKMLLTQPEKDKSKLLQQRQQKQAYYHDKKAST